MGLFQTSISAVSRHGVFAIERTPPTAITPTGTDIACIVGQFPWGPGGATATIGKPSSVGEFRRMYAPPGFTRTGSAYLMTLAAAFPRLYAYRVLGSAAVKSTINLTAAGPTNIVSVTALYAGAEGDGIVCTVAAADDGDANHFNLTVTKTGASGTTSDVFKNLNYSGVGTESSPDFTITTLVGAITKLASGRPTNGAYTLAGGSNGTINATEYVGSAGTGDRGFAKLETDLTIRHVFADEMGDALRATVNAGLKSHASSMRDRVGYLAGDSGQTAAQAQSDVANYRDGNVVYADPHAYVYDDTDGTKRLIPPQGFAASVAAQLPPSCSIAWKHPKVRAMLRNIVELEAERGDAAGTNTALGITTLIAHPQGGFCFEAGKVTDLTTGKTNLTRTLMGIYIAKSIVDSIGASVDAPNVPLFQQDIMNAVDEFLATLKKNRDQDPENAPFIEDYAISDVGVANSSVSISQGNFIVEANVKIGSSMERIFLSLQYGETVKVTAQ